MLKALIRFLTSQLALWVTQWLFRTIQRSHDPPETFRNQGRELSPLPASRSDNRQVLDLVWRLNG